MIHLDTHVIVWLATGERGRISRPARALIERESCEISPIVILELEMLFERNRIDRDASAVVAYLQRETGLAVSRAPLDIIVEHARSFAWARDPLDRLIMANAMADGARLVTADTVMLERFSAAVW